MGALWIGVDIGKAHHHVVAVDDTGTIVHSEEIANAQRDITALIARIGRRRHVRWAVDIRTGPAALLLAILLGHDADVRYVSGSIAARMAPAFHGDHKTDAKDAYVLAQILRLRNDLPRIATGDGTQTELKLLTARRLDLVDERIRTIARLQDLLTMISPELARVLDLTLKGPVRLLARWQTPAAIRHAGATRITAELRAHRITNAAALAQAAVTAARAQTVTVAGEATAAEIIAQLAGDLQTVNDRITAVEKLITTALARHHLTPIITSLPGMGPILAAEFIAHTGGLDRYPNPGALAAHAGLIPVPRQSGRIKDRQRRPHRYHRGLRRVFAQSTLSALTACPTSRAYYDKKRAEGKTHRQAAAALSRRRVDVLWACIRDNTPYQPKQPRPVRCAAA